MAYRYTRIALAVNASGAVTAYSDPTVGTLHGFAYVHGDLDTGADLTVTDEATGIALLTVTNAGTTDKFILPRAPVVDAANAASLYAAAGEPIEDLMPLFGRVKVVVAQGGTSKTGSLYVLWDDGR